MTTATCGRTSPTPFAFYDPDSRSLRTSQGTFPWDSTQSSPTLPTSGSMRSGRCYEHRTSVPAISEPDCSSLLPTPNVAGGGKKIPEDAVWSGKAAYKPDGTKVQVHIDRIAMLLPTPAAMNPNDGERLESWQARREREKAKHQNGNGFGTPLSIAVRMLPTPTARESKDSDAPGRQGGSSLYVEVKYLPTPKSTNNENRQNLDRYGPNLGMVLTELSGATSPTPSPNTNDSSADALPGQLTIEDA